MSTLKQHISYGLWLDKEAEEAAKFYTSIFPNSNVGDITRYGKEGYEIHQQPEGKVMTVTFQLSNLEFTAINGGPLFKLNPSISFFVVAETEKETDTIWNKLLEGGSVLMPLDKYPWSEKYGWVQDRYGLSWQIGLGKIADVGQKITPSLLFVNEQYRRAEEAINFYTSIFDDSGIDGILKYEPGEGDQQGAVKHAQFKLLGQKFMAMDSGMDHHFTFNEAISIIINCKTQKEIDYYWNKLSEDGEEGQCGWLKDKFGVSWQVESERLVEMLKDPDKNKTERVTKAFLKMRKFNVDELEKVFNG